MAREKERWRTARLSDERLPIAPWPSNEDACYRRYRLFRVLQNWCSTTAVLFRVVRAELSREANEKANYLGVNRLTWLVAPISQRDPSQCRRSRTFYQRPTCQSLFAFSHRTFCVYKIPSETSTECIIRFQQPVISPNRRQFRVSRSFPILQPSNPRHYDF